jgi:hypothetical protein
MASRLQRSAGLAACLGTLFASGLAIGYRFGQHTSRSSTAPLADPTISPADWTSRACEALQNDLDLSPAQGERVRSHIATASQGIFVDRERALLQIHLRILEVHDLLASDASLDDHQKVRLKASRAKLRRLITSRFADLLREAPDSLPLLQEEKA